ncbi:MAG TPA: hypothetical protein VFO16_18840, partial [Pseudonocardiaceae bacterium]|nr:hypothetical protein [Pseudonocardiaceae bacterium]
GFTYPRFPGPPDCPGLPLNLEALVRGMEAAERGLPPVIKQIRGGQAVIEALFHLRHYWEHGDGSIPPGQAESYHHNLAIYGWDVADAYTRTVGQAVTALNAPSGVLAAVSLKVRHDDDRAMLITLRGPQAQQPGNTTTMVDAASWLGQHGGIDTLVVALGANNALSSVVRLRLVWSDHPDQSPTVSTPTDFDADLHELVQRIKVINARRVIWATVPHVTVAPIARGIEGKPPGQRYFGRYIHPWIDERDFLPAFHPSLTAHQAWAIDAAIDQYNYSIKKVVYQARTGQPGRDWLILDLCGLLDRLAFRRYINDPTSQPSWWSRKSYALPDALAALTPTPDTRFFLADSSGRTQGGLFSLDGVHPTTIGYAILADEVLKTIDHATGVEKPRQIDFARYINADTLILHPPSSLAGDLRPIAQINTIIDVAQTLLRQPRL